jgi:hypothetical protein
LGVVRGGVTNRRLHADCDCPFQVRRVGRVHKPPGAAAATRKYWQKALKS